MTKKTSCIRNFPILGLFSLCVPTGCYTGVGAGAAGGAGMDGGGASGAATGWEGGSGESGDDGAGPEGEDAVVPFAGLRRLTRAEYDRAVDQLFDDATRPAQGFELDEHVGFFAANRTSPVGSQQLGYYVSVAEAVARRALADHPERIRTCTDVSEACARQWIVALGRRVFRRPLFDDEAQAYVADYLAWVDEFSDEDAVVLTVQGMLISPHFLYVIEVGEGNDPSPDDVVDLTDYEIATRMSLFLWGGIPDDALLDAAQAGQLHSTEQIEAQAERMLADPKATGFLDSYFHDWLDVRRLEDAQKNVDFFPQWDEELRASMMEETRRFVAHAFQESEPVATLYGASYTFVNAKLAAFYGVEDQYSGEGWARVELDPARRAGLLTQSGFLAGHAHGADPSVVFRGHFVRSRVLCEPLPAPPDDVVAMGAEDGDRLMDPKCVGCHQFMDPIGKAFDIYDAVGAVRTSDAAGDTIPTHGEVVTMGPLSEQVAGPFSHPVELLKRLGASEAVAECTARNLYAFAHRRVLREADDAALETIRSSTDLADVSLDALALAIVTSHSFRQVRLEFPED